MVAERQDNSTTEEETVFHQTTSPCRARKDELNPLMVHYVLAGGEGVSPITPDELQHLLSSPYVAIAEAEGDDFGGHYGVKIVVEHARQIGPVHDFVVETLGRRRPLRPILH